MTDGNGEGRTESSIVAEKRQKEEKDDFWEIDMLLPNGGKSFRTAPRRAPGATDTTEISFGGAQTVHVGGDGISEVGDSPLNLNAGEDEVIVRRFIPQHISPSDVLSGSVRDEPVIAYENDRSLVHRVRVYPWASSYHYYRDFCTDAQRYLACEPEEGSAPPAYVPFFSYVPQYSQLRRDQLLYYFYWRWEFRRGNAIKTDDSYLYLYIYEILNTAGSETAPEDGLRMLYRLFYTYGRENTRLSRLLAEWIVDYSLIFRLSVPEEARAEADFYRTYQAMLKEFYIAPPGGAPAGYAELLLRYASAYDYKSSHFYTGNNRAYYDRYLLGALTAVIRQYSDGTKLFSGTGLRDSHMVRNAFEQALCSHRIRYRIEVDYASFSRSHEMRYLVSDILKYTENRLRGFLGIKSRLTVYSLSNEVKKCIDRYCDENFPRKTAESGTRKREELPAYEKLYDLPDTPLDLSHAAEIELSSWETTRRLTEAFSDTGAAEESETESASSLLDEKEHPVSVSEAEPNVSSDTAKFAGGLASLLGDLYPFAEAAYRGDLTAETAFSAEKGMLADVIADRINELAADELGDILLVDDGDGYTVIEDYRPLFEEAKNE